MSDSGVFGVPRRARDLVRRPALEERLDDGAMITTVSAGAGFGKTTLLASWAASRTDAGVWVDGSIAPGDRVSFWENVFRVVGEASRADPASFGAVVVPGRPLDEASVGAAVATFARSLSAPFVLVVDGAHAIDLDAVAHDLVAFVRFARDSRLVVADRRHRFRPRLLASDVEETVVTGEELRLTVDETAALVSSSPHRGSERIAPAEVHRLTDGVPGLVRRVARSSSKAAAHRDVARDLLQPWSEEVASAEAATAGAPADRADAPAVDAGLRALMLASLGRASVAEAADVIGSAAHVAALESAAARGLGWWDEADVVFPPVVALAAHRELTESLPPAERRRVATRFVQVFANRGDAVNAFGLALDAEDFDLAVAIGKRSFLQLVRDDAPGLLLRLKRIPLARLRRQPLLVLFIAILHMQSPRGRAAAMLHFRLAEQLARATEATAAPDDRALMVGVRSATTRMQGRFEKSTPIAREFLDRFDRLTPEEQDRLSSLSRHVLWQVAHTLLFAGDTRGAIEAAQRMLAVTVPPDLGEDRGVHPALTLIAAVQAVDGSIQDSGDTLAEALTHPPRASAFHHVWETTASAFAALERGEFASALALVDDLDHDMADGEYWPFDLVVRVLADLGDGRLDAAIELARARLTGSNPPRQANATRDVVIVVYALLCLAGRPAGTAAGVLRHVSRPGALRWFAEAMIALREGEHLKAVGLTRNALGDGVGSPRLRSAVLLVRAAASSSAGQSEAAERAAVSAFEIMASEGLATPWLLLTATERADVLRSARAGSVPAALRDALDRMPVVFGQDAANVERLTAREQEVLAQLVTGATVPEVARTSGVSPNTVKTQRARIYRKLGVDNRRDAARVALEHDLL